MTQLVKCLLCKGGGLNSDSSIHVKARHDLTCKTQGFIGQAALRMKWFPGSLRDPVSKNKNGQKSRDASNICPNLQRHKDVHKSSQAY